jgi:thioredoxin reductase
MGYDWDVIVVGGGPAGISAAIRTRWVKRYKSVPCSTLLIENAQLGGLAGWRGCIFTGPSWKLDREEIVERMLTDLRGLHIEVHQGRVSRIVDRGPVKEVFTSDGRVFRALAVIVATGIKVLVNEKDYLGRGLEVTSMGYEYVISQLKSLLSKRWNPRLIVVGSPKLDNMIPLIRELNRARSPLLFVIEGEGEGDEDVVRGWVDRYWGQDRLEGIGVHTPQGPRDIPCAGALLDFNSYELSPSSRVDMGTGWPGSSFVEVDADMQTASPGILAAGDATAGGYNSFARAVSQGMTAGLSAYRYVYGRKFGADPPLFAYRPADFALRSDYRELPEPDDRLRPRALVDPAALEAALGVEWHWLIDRLSGRHSIREIADEKGIEPGELKDPLERLLAEKMLTFHMEVAL